MDATTVLILVLGVAAAYSLSQWQLWKNRAVMQNDQRNAAVGQVERANEMMGNLDDERKLSHDAMMNAFDYLNDNQPFGQFDIGLMEVRKVLLHAIQNSTYGRGK